MASLGVRKFEDLIGHTEYLTKVDAVKFEKARNLSFERILFKDPALKNECYHHEIAQIHDIDKALDKAFEDTVNKAISSKKAVTIETPIININRSFATYTSGIVAASKEKLKDDLITFKISGTAGQSLGAFLQKGITIDLLGQARGCPAAISLSIRARPLTEIRSKISLPAILVFMALPQAFAASAAY